MAGLRLHFISARHKRGLRRMQRDRVGFAILSYPALDELEPIQFNVPPCLVGKQPR